jgi:hypothetical protein
MAGSGVENGLHCEICGNPLTGKQRRACSQKCRDALRTRAAADRKNLEREVAEHEVTKAVQAEVAAQVGAVTQEVMTEQVLQHIRRFVHLVPQALDAIEKNLGSDDPDVRQKAATTLLRYTLGNPSVAPPSLEQEKPPIKIEFGIPRADTVGPAKGGGIRPLLDSSDLPDLTIDGVEATSIDAESLDLDDVETCEKRICMECNNEKCVDEFVGNSFRCKDCDARLQARVREQFGKVNLG